MTQTRPEPVFPVGFDDDALTEDLERWWERILMGMSLALFFCAIGLLILGAASGELYAFGGSGATGTAAVLGMLRLVLDKESESAAHRAG